MLKISWEGTSWIKSCMSQKLSWFKPKFPQVEFEIYVADSKENLGTDPRA